MTSSSLRSRRPSLAALACTAWLVLGGVALAQDTLRIGTWNLEQLGFRQPPRTAADVQAIADRIHDLGVGVLAVQEVAGPAPLQQLTKDLGPTWDFVIGSTGWFSDHTGRISVGFVYDRSQVELLEAEELLQLPREENGLPIFHRVPVTAVFRTLDGGLDFRAVTVHLKASRGAANEAKRVAEVSALATWIDALRARDGEDRDLVVMGDFNHTYGAPANQAFTSHCPIVYLQPSRPMPTIVHFDEPIDMIAIAPDFSEEVVTGSMAVHGEQAQQDKEAWRKTYSDHVPVTVDLDASHDRDPNATFEDVDPRHRLLPGGWAAAELLGDSGAVPAPGAGNEDPFVAGAIVVVTLTGEGPGPAIYQGRLITTLQADWVRLQLDDGSAVAIPARAIRSVQRTRASAR